MQVSKTHLAIAVGTAFLLVAIFLGYVEWLSHQPPVLSRSAERDPLTKMPLSITMNPLRDRTVENTAAAFIAQMRDGNCRQLLSAWEKDYRKKRADFICTSETQHPLIGWNLVEREDMPPLVILYYRGTALLQRRAGRDLQRPVFGDGRKERCRLGSYKVRRILLRQWPVDSDQWSLG